MACLQGQYLVVIYDLDTGEQKEIEIKHPRKCAASQYFFAVTTYEDELHLFSTDGVLLYILPETMGACCAAFHPHNTNILAIGYGDGAVCMWDLSTQACMSSFEEHIDLITNLRFTPDCRLFLSSWDNTASIVALDDGFQYLSSVKLEGHTRAVTDILPLLSSNQCVTCSADKTIKVWDCETGTCLRTLTEHTFYVMSLAMHPNKQTFASGSYDRAVIIWSSETFEVLHRMEFPDWVKSVIFAESDTLYAGVCNRGVVSCDALTGEIGAVIIPAAGSCESLSLG